MILFLLFILFIVCSILWFIFHRRSTPKNRQHDTSELTDMFYTEQLSNIEKLDNFDAFTIYVSRKNKNTINDSTLNIEKKFDAIKKATELLLNEKVHYVKVEENSESLISLTIPSFCLRDINNEIVHLTISGHKI